MSDGREPGRRGTTLMPLGHPLLRTPHIDALASDGVVLAATESGVVGIGPAKGRPPTYP